jgi:hypothetical protein
MWRLAENTTGKNICWQEYWKLVEDEDFRAIGSENRNILANQYSCQSPAVCNTFTTMKRFLESGWLDVPIAARCFELSVLTLTDTARDAIDLQLGKYLLRTLAEPLLRLGVGQDAPLPFAHGGHSTRHHLNGITCCH